MKKHSYELEAALTLIEDLVEPLTAAGISCSPHGYPEGRAALTFKSKKELYKAVDYIVVNCPNVYGHIHTPVTDHYLGRVKHAGFLVITAAKTKEDADYIQTHYPRLYDQILLVDYDSCTILCSSNLIAGVILDILHARDERKTTTPKTYTIQLNDEGMSTVQRTLMDKQQQLTAMEIKAQNNSMIGPQELAFIKQGITRETLLINEALGNIRKQYK